MVGGLVSTVAMLAGMTGISAVPGAAAEFGAQDRPCTAGDLQVHIGSDLPVGKERRAFVVRYEATSASTSCRLYGAPDDAVFYAPAGQTAPGISASAEPGMNPEPVVVDQGNPGESLIFEPQQGQRNPVGAVSFALPSTASDRYVKVPWPHAPVRGADVTVGQIASA
ncbi:hypothetical protein [Sciscionella sediminilitoris]|uniref:hypothetical protein n=1 Tax=Sciscionella sediminilitoris TaxID=1445613 RepID=UPI0004DF88F8|nr:hypothetical protein [Sciscionella sp. SE31]